MAEPVTQKDAWRGGQGDTWVRLQPLFDAMIGQIGLAALQAADPQPGERVVDVGCGAGETTMELARRVRPGKEVVGLDISPGLLEHARARAKAADLEYIAFTEADASEAVAPPAPYDLMFSRFGVMFFDDPAAAFTNLYGWLRPGGRLTFACWGPRKENTWVMLPMGIARNHFEVPRVDPRTPGPFAFEEPEYIAEFLMAAGFDEVGIGAWAGDLAVGGAGASAEQAADFYMEGTMLAGLIEANQPDTAAIRRDLLAALADYETPSGIQVPGKAWIVTASV
jgi:SAM-dependent methyltransferase